MGSAVVVPGEGIEPSLCCQNWILSPARLPIPPSRLEVREAWAKSRRCSREVEPALSRKTAVRDRRARVVAIPCTMSERPGYRLSDFDYDLPAALIAQTPAAKRAGSRLLHVAGATLTDRAFADLPELLAPGDLLVLNDTKVIRSRLHGRRETGGRVELLLERIVAPDEAWMQLSASHPPKPGGRLLLDGGASAIVQERDGRFVRLRFDADSPLDVYLERHGEVPLPPYIRRAAGTADSERYQTIYARHPGAVAAPTAGLHFDAAMIASLQARGVVIAYVTLHVGAGTFQPVRVDDLSKH